MAIDTRRRGNHLSGVGPLNDRPLEGRRVLVAEDNVILSMHVAEVLEAAGAEVVGPYPFPDEALGAVRHDVPDAAVLDYELMNGTSKPIAQALSRRGVPYAYFTSHERGDLDDPNQTVPVLGKPNDAEALISAVTGILKT